MKSVVSLVERRGVKRVRLLIEIEGIPQDIINSKDEGWGKHFDVVIVKGHFYVCEKYEGSVKGKRRNEWETWTLPRESALVLPSFQETPSSSPSSSSSSSPEWYDDDEDVEMVER